MTRKTDCMVAGIACVDVILQPIPLDRPLGNERDYHLSPIQAVTGGCVPNCSIAMSRLGLNVGALTMLGDDLWGQLIRNRLSEEQVDCTCVIDQSDIATSVTAVLIDEHGEHAFAYDPDAYRKIDHHLFFDHMDSFSESQFVLIGYYPLLPNLQSQLPEVLCEIRKRGCRTALDAADGGGTLQPLDRMLPHLDIYIPSQREAESQTGETDPQRMIRVFREYATDALLGIKMGANGVLLSPSREEFLEIKPVTLPGPLVDTTGAGDSFYAGFITGLIRGLGTEQAGRLGAAAGACCVTGLGASEGVRNFENTWKLI